MKKKKWSSGISRGTRRKRLKIEDYLRVLEQLTLNGGKVTVGIWGDKAAETHGLPSEGVRASLYALLSNMFKNDFKGRVSVDLQASPREYSLIKEKILRNDVRADRVRSHVIEDGERIALENGAEYLGIRSLEAIASSFRVKGLKVSPDHARAINNPKHPGKHEVMNLHLLIQQANCSKGADNWERMSAETQIAHLRYYAHSLYLPRFGKVPHSVTNMLDLAQKLLEVIYSHNYRCKGDGLDFKRSRQIMTSNRSASKIQSERRQVG